MNILVKKCKCQCHHQTTYQAICEHCQPQPATGWVEEAKKTIRMFWDKDYCSVCGVNPEKWEEELNKLRKSTIEEVVRVVEGMKRNTPHTAVHKDLVGHHIGYNQAIVDLTSKLKNLK